VCKADNLTNFLGHCHLIWEPYLPGTLWGPRACNGTALPLLHYFLFAVSISLRFIFINPIVFLRFMEETIKCAVSYFLLPYFEDEIVPKTYLYTLSLSKTGN